MPLVLTIHYKFILEPGVSCIRISYSRISA